MSSFVTKNVLPVPPSAQKFVCPTRPDGMGRAGKLAVGCDTGDTRRREREDLSWRIGLGSIPVPEASRLRGPTGAVIADRKAEQVLGRDQIGGDEEDRDREHHRRPLEE